MAQKRRFVTNKRQAARTDSVLRGLRRPPDVAERPAPIVYGKPFIVAEDEQKNTFVFQGGSWVPHTASIAECRQTCQVKELPQRLNKLIRYEVRCPQAARS
jgi:hypothetical protein